MTFAWYAHLKNLAGRFWYVSVFLPFAMLYMKQPFKIDYLYAAVCILGAVYFIFRNPQG